MSGANELLPFRLHVWTAVFTFNPYLLISINELLISIIHLLISIIQLLISIKMAASAIFFNSKNELLISIKMATIIVHNEGSP